jgi:cellulose synthase/poly-beta-1,6-N-acetylglucosamine synthase-like glycosyltransferase
LWRRSPFPELDCLRDRLSLGMIAAVERRAVALGVSADRVLIAGRVLDEESYVIELANWLGWDYESFEHRYRGSCPLDDRALLEATRNGLLPLVIDGEVQFVVAPRSVRQLLDYAARHPRVRFRLASTARLNGFVADFAAEALGKEAADGLRRRSPDLSAGTGGLRKWLLLAPLLTFIVGVLLAVPGPALAVIETALAACFLTWLLFRLLGCFTRPKLLEAAPLADRDLPVYTIIVALYHEGTSVEGLIASLRALDYPPEKLDIKLVIEADDLETASALQRLRLSSPFEIIVAPEAGPQTKPKALNAALPFARGTFAVVYDAEDRPEPAQLRRAVDMFLAESDAVGCVQARLTIDNTRDGWLARLFTAEYAAQFDLFLPGLARMGLPLPLGGSSNHFRTDVLRAVGAWDSYNVTEDADLGMRLARYGYRSAVIDSTTYEEAPARWRAWVRQRTRWFKGWMQTWMVHMCHPFQLLRQLGLGGFLTFQLAVGGNVLAALVHPIFFVMLIHAIASGQYWFDTGDIANWTFTAALGAGYLVTVVVGLRGLARRGLLSVGWSFVGVILHWLLLSFAAWRALIQLLIDPYRWEKTEHGLAKHSRLAAMRAVVAMEVSEQEPAEQVAAPRRDAA